MFCLLSTVCCVLCACPFVCLACMLLLLWLVFGGTARCRAGGGVLGGGCCGGGNCFLCCFLIHFYFVFMVDVVGAVLCVW